MNLSEETKNQIIQELTKRVVRISDQKYQERVWIRGEGPECDDFDETLCQFFDITDPVLDDYKNFHISDTQYHLLIAFCDKLNTFSQYDYPPQKFIESPEWKKIMTMANEVLQAFNYPARRI